MSQARSLLWALVLSLLVHTGAVLGLRGLGFGPRPLPPLFVELATPVVAQPATSHEKPPAPSRVEPLPGPPVRDGGAARTVAEAPVGRPSSRAFRKPPAPAPTPLPVMPALSPSASPPDRLIASVPVPPAPEIGAPASPDRMGFTPPPPSEPQVAPSRPSPSPVPRPAPSPVAPAEGGRDRPRPVAARSVPQRVGPPDPGPARGGGLGGDHPAGSVIGSSAPPGQSPADPGAGSALDHSPGPAKEANRGEPGSGGVRGSGDGPGPLARLPRGPEETGGAPPEYRAYLEGFRRKVQESLVYPAPALRRRLQGTVRLEVRLLDTGEVARVVILRSSGHATLDEAAVRTVEDAGPFPFPMGLPSRPLTIHLPVVFELR